MLLENDIRKGLEKNKAMDYHKNEHGKPFTIDISRQTYLVEVDDEYKVGYMPEDVVFCEQDDIELLKEGVPQVIS